MKNFLRINFCQVTSIIFCTLKSKAHFSIETCFVFHFLMLLLEKLSSLADTVYILSLIDSLELSMLCLISEVLLISLIRQHVAKVTSCKESSSAVSVAVPCRQGQLKYVPPPTFHPITFHPITVTV